MKKKCIACGGELKEVAFTGKIADMEVDFCDAHAHYCENCDMVVMHKVSNK